MNKNFLDDNCVFLLKEVEDYLSQKSLWHRQLNDPLYFSLDEQRSKITKVLKLLSDGTNDD